MMSVLHHPTSDWMWHCLWYAGHYCVSPRSRSRRLNITSRNIGTLHIYLLIFSTKSKITRMPTNFAFCVRSKKMPSIKSTWDSDTWFLKIMRSTKTLCYICQKEIPGTYYLFVHWMARLGEKDTIPLDKIRRNRSSIYRKTSYSYRVKKNSKDLL